MSVNEVRALEDLNGIGKRVTSTWVQVNQIPLDSAADYGDKLTSDA